MTAFPAARRKSNFMPSPVIRCSTAISHARSQKLAVELFAHEQVAENAVERQVQIVAADKLRRGFEKACICGWNYSKETLPSVAISGVTVSSPGTKTHQRAFKKAHVDKQRAARKAQDLARKLTHRLRILLILMVIGATE